VDFPKETVPLRSSAEMTTVKYLNYLVYDNSTGLSYTEGFEEDSNGSITGLKLPEGEYTIVFIANNDEFPVVTPQGNIYANVGIHPCFAVGPFDQFYAKSTCTVERNKENKYSVTLHRIVGKIEIVLTDVVASLAPFVQLISYEMPSWECYFSATAEWVVNPVEMGYARYQQMYVSSATVGMKIELYLLENINKAQERFPVNIQLLARSTDPNSYEDAMNVPPETIIAAKTIPNVDILKNKIVRYTGTLLDGPNTDPGQPSSSFTITVDATWGSTVDDDF
jgi:hypothetical protein